VVDDKLILRKIAELEIYFQQVSEFRAISLKEYQEDWKVQRIIERTLQMMIETCTDIAGHIISDCKYRLPKNYADVFKVLEENGTLDESLCDTMQQMAKFRNIVVHDYDKVDVEIVIGILRKRLGDFNRFKETIVKNIKVLRTDLKQ